MAKVKMGDIKSGSENVKNVFRRAMSSRTSKWMQKQTYTNDELLEILQLSENIEHHGESRYFYQRLIEYQKGPFNAEVFTKFKDKLFHVDSLLNLLTQSKGVSNDEKAHWIEYAILTSGSWFVSNFFSNGESTKYGINVEKKPFNITLAEAIVRYAHKVSRGKMPDFYVEALHKSLNSMNDDEIHNWYLSVVASTYEDKSLAILTNYPRTPGKTIEHFYNRSKGSVGQQIVMHPNCPGELRAEVYEKTGDEKYLPQEAKDIFLF